jgi:hypothetical protein
MKKNDIVIFSSVAIIALVGILLLAFFSPSAQYAVITVDGNVVARLPLDVDTEYRIESERGYNLLVIKDGVAYISEASCPNHDCMRRGILEDITPIVCSPNKVIVTLEEN